MIFDFDVRWLLSKQLLLETKKFPFGDDSCAYKSAVRKKRKVAPEAQLFFFFSQHYKTVRPSSPKGNFLVSKGDSHFQPAIFFRTNRFWYMSFLVSKDAL
jgi:hypothetical protein